MKKIIRNSHILLLLLVGQYVNAQHNTTVKEYSKIFTTYPFSDPNPVADPSSKIYPYFRYDGFTNTPVQKAWKVVELENDYLKVMILPEVGGKIWNAIEKSTGRSFVYDNSVVKFRDVAMRGPWTSGGIEPNYGIIGHTPNCATPVDYAIIQKTDGSISCVIGVLDLLTQTPWRLDINLPKDKAYITTSSFWYNGTPMEQAYYTWMNTGIKAKGNLEFIYPGTHYLGHEGEYSDWPVNKENGKTISFYENNDFGGYKSYHVFGKYTDFFGGYWHDDEFGMGRYSTHDDKAGKKIWIWGLSQQGMIWDKILTDTDGQYVEVQSGRLFNQASDNSTLTPFKHQGFAPYTTDSWTEYWFPVKQTHGFVKANNYGALNVKNEKGLLKIYFSALQNINDSFIVSTGSHSIYAKRVQLNTMQQFADSFATTIPLEKITVTIGGTKMVYQAAPEADVVNRPLNAPANFDWNSVYGLYLQGKEDIRLRYFPEAADKLKACLQKDSNFVPALTELATIQYRNLQYQEALANVQKSLSINTYDPAANYYYGLINMQLGNITDAKDGLDIAAQSSEYRSAAYTALSKIYFRQQNFTSAMDYAGKSLITNQYNMDAYELMAIIYRLQNNEAKAGNILNTMLGLDPLNHFAHVEQYLWHTTTASKENISRYITNELPQQTYLALVIKYANLGCTNEALQVIAMAPQDAELAYWKAFLSKQPVDASALTPSLVAPVSSETITILEQLISTNPQWLLKYHLALAWWSRNNTNRAKELFTACNNEPQFAPFYATKAKLFTDDALANLEKAESLSPDEWRYKKAIAEYAIEHNDYARALTISDAFYKKHPDNFIIGMLYARSLLLNKQYAACDALLTKIDIIPFEGATDGRGLYHEAKLMQAVDAMKKKQYKTALNFIKAAKIWPVNLGVGKPYQQDIDERLEDWLTYLCYTKQNNAALAQQALQKLIAFTPKIDNTVRNFLPANNLISAWAYDALQNHAAAEQLLNQWQQKEPSNAIFNWCKTQYETPGKVVNDNVKNESVRIINALLQLP
ncbi:DUF5107 domain-containing protein [Limnovirga soli]|uniref:DUF5107 domain-containing protein n=1 Tax=Limnovirga soli TaxID=2656915 RepID=A0A8J8FFZ7_9BACT|nr:DUF5107 domain-containing protein [Limnovirga soli]NNV55957.1 DUF5107 domain-containing protein [Limnovirga soli]